MRGRVRTSVAAVLLATVYALGGCHEAANLPLPWPGYRGTGETLVQGSAFGVAIGMTQAQAQAVLTADRRFSRSGVSCSLGRPGDYQPDITTPIDASNAVCPPRDAIEETWEAHPSLLCGICESEILELSIGNDKVRQIRFHGSGNMLG